MMRQQEFVTAIAIAFVMCLGAASDAEETGMESPSKTTSAFYPEPVVERAKVNAAGYDWAKAIRDAMVDRAWPWRELSDDALWDLMFGPNISRSWMVWSNGYCPACKQDVRMYDWVMDPWNHRYKVKCPHCAQLFPTNDFVAFHQSGLDEHGVFQPTRADRALLFNAEHPDPTDPMHLFGVDDGEGYVNEKGERWRFIGCYLIYGQWKRLIQQGAVNLGAAYAVTGEPEYARKAAILLDRVADLYPQFDFGTQGLVYERRDITRGQISTWHDACEEVRQLALAYDQIFEGAKSEEGALTAFLSAKSKAMGVSNPKSSWADIQRNIEQGIFRDTLEHRERIESNYPRTDVTMLIIEAVLDWPGNRDTIMSMLDAIIEKATAVDGVSGEKGIAGYSTIAPHAVAEILGRFSLLEEGFLADVYARHPRIHDMYRFHIDTWVLDGKYYPQVGDSGGFGSQNAQYEGISLNPAVGIEPSPYVFLHDLYTLTGDIDFVRILYRGNESSVTDLPHDIFAADPSAFQSEVRALIDQHGSELDPGSVNKAQWHLAILASGAGEHRRALWIDYDSGGRHSHHDGMNIGLFAKGLDLIPEFGYPLVGYGGWDSPIGLWYKRTAAHVTVAVDEQDHSRAEGGENDGITAGQVTLWADGDMFHAVRASGPEIAGVQQFERTVALVDVNERDAYVVDVFRVAGGKDHAKFFHSFFGEVELQGVQLEASAEFGHDTQMRNFRTDAHPKLGWSATWRIDDRYDYLPDEARVGLRYTDLTVESSATLCEGMVDVKQFGSGSAEWIPSLITRRTKVEPPLQSTFVSVIEPFDGQPFLTSIRRLPLETMNSQALPDPYVGVGVVFADGREDILLLLEGRGPAEVVEPQSKIHFKGEAAMVRRRGGHVERIALAKGSWIKVGDISVMVNGFPDLVEIMFDDGKYRVTSGDAEAVEFVRKGESEIERE